MNKLKFWSKEIEKFEKIDLKTAKKLNKKMLDTKDKEERIEIRNNIINSTLYVILNFLNNSDLEILENGYYDMEDIISATIEFYIKELNSGKILTINNFSKMFNSNYYSYLNSIFVPFKDDISISKVIGIENFGELMEIYLYLKRNKEKVTFEEYLELIKSKRWKYVSKELCYKGFKEFESIYKKIKIDDESIPSKTKLKHMRHLLVGISLYEKLNSEMEITEDFEDNLIDRYETACLVNKILTSEDLNNLEVSVLVNRFGLKDGKIKTLSEVGSMLGCSKAYIRQIEAKTIRKIRRKYNKKDYL